MPEAWNASDVDSLVQAMHAFHSEQRTVTLLFVRAILALCSV